MILSAFLQKLGLLFFLNTPGIVHFKEISRRFLSVFPLYLNFESQFTELEQWKKKVFYPLSLVILKLVKFLNI